MSDVDMVFPQPSKEAVTQFFRAAKEGDLAAVRQFLDTYNNQGIDEKDQDTATALMYAARNGHKEVVRLLLERGASPHERNMDGRTVLMFAVSGEDKEIITWLIGRGVALDAQTKIEGHTALMVATGSHLLDIARLLLDRGASLNKTDNGISAVDGKGQTALMMAKRYGIREGFIALFEQEQKRRRRAAFSVFTEGLQKDFRSPKSPFKPLRRKP